MPEGYFLSEADKKAIQSLLSAFHRRTLNTTGRPRADWVDSDLHAPDVYIAKTQEDGIEALDEPSLSPGSADCDIYRVVEQAGEPSLLQHAFTKRVHNVSVIKVPRYQWIMVVRDKAGSWFAVEIPRRDHFPARVSEIHGGGSYTVIEQYPPGEDVEDGLEVDAHEFNDVAHIDVDTRVEVFIFNKDGDTTYWFEYCCDGTGSDDHGSDHGSDQGSDTGSDQGSDTGSEETGSSSIPTIPTSCCSQPITELLYATFSSSGCSNYDGHTVPMTFRPNLILPDNGDYPALWQADGAPTPDGAVAQFYCVTSGEGSTWGFVHQNYDPIGPSGCYDGWYLDDYDCDALIWHFHAVVMRAGVLGCPNCPAEAIGSTIYCTVTA